MLNSEAGGRKQVSNRFSVRKFSGLRLREKSLTRKNTLFLFNRFVGVQLIYQKIAHDQYIQILNKY